MYWRDLYFVIDYRSGYSLKLANRLANSKHYVKSMELGLRSRMNDDMEVSKILKNDLDLLTVAPEAIKTLRGLYPLTLEIYNTKTNCVPIRYFDDR